MIAILLVIAALVGFVVGGLVVAIYLRSVQRAHFKAVLIDRDWFVRKGTAAMLSPVTKATASELNRALGIKQGARR